ncbi:MAG: Tudor-knot domain-containing protein [Bacteroidota bacterium]
MKLNRLLLHFFIFLAIGINAQTYKNGEKLMAFEDDDNLWYEATILEAGDARSKIHWEGFSADYDETITNKRFWKKGYPFLAGDAMQAMETDGKWYNVKILKDGTGTEKYYIHWVGFSDSYDRYISYDSIRLPTKANQIAKPESASQSSASSTRISIVYIENKTEEQLITPFLVMV